MSAGSEGPSRIARRLASRLAVPRSSGWKRQTYVLPREEVRAMARDWLKRFPREAYGTEVEFWRETPDGAIEFTMRRLPSAD